MTLSTTRTIIDAYPLSDPGRAFIDESRNTVVNILNGRDPRLLLVFGPCSIHNTQEALDYANKFKTLANEIESSAFCVMRTYFEKPRTREGWKGLIYDPKRDGSFQIEEGLHLARRLLVELAHLGVPAATEFLTPQLAPYLQDLISWGSIGARTSSSQIHRQLASDFPFPIGFKNTVDGNIQTAVEACIVTHQSQPLIHSTQDNQTAFKMTPGNPHAHIILRGTLNGPNYDPKTIQKALRLLQKHHLPERIVIDCSHGNAQGNPFNQIGVFKDIIEQIKTGNQAIKGLMLESQLESGAQHPETTKLEYGVSITDACLSFNETAALITSSLPTSLPVS